jgi:hypothetical protein
MAAWAIFHDPITVLYYHGCISFEALGVRAAAMLYKTRLRFQEDMNSIFKLKPHSASLRRHVDTGIVFT